MGKTLRKLRTISQVHFTLIALFAMLFLIPIGAGFWVTLRASFGVLPAIGASEFGFQNWLGILATPGIWKSTITTVFVGFLSTLISTWLALASCRWVIEKSGKSILSRLINPILAVPHAAMAIGFAFMISPSGSIARAISPILTGWEQPPIITTTNDIVGLSLSLGLIIKEFPFLLLLSLSAYYQLPVSAQRQVTRTLGHSDHTLWRFVFYPQIIKKITLPIVIVFCYSLSAVEMAIILGPTNPPTLSVFALRMFNSPDSSNIMLACAISILLAGLTIVGIWICQKLIRIYLIKIASNVENGRFKQGQKINQSAPRLVASLLVFFGIGSLLLLLTWSFTWRWSFPNIFPETLSFKIWQKHQSGAFSLMGVSLLIAVTSAMCCISFVLVWLETFTSHSRIQALFGAVIFLPLLLPQISFLFGFSIISDILGTGAELAKVVIAHSLFVLPYTFLTLVKSWRDIPIGIINSARTLGAGKWRVFFKIKLPILLGPIATCFAIAIAVSFAQFLPTLFAGNGRVETLTTEAISLSSGSDRRLSAIYGSLLAAPPLVFFVISVYLPRWIYRNRKQMLGTS